MLKRLTAGKTAPFGVYGDALQIVRGDSKEISLLWVKLSASPTIIKMKITDEERKEAEKRLKGLTWFGDKDEVIEGIVKGMREEINFG